MSSEPRKTVRADADIPAGARLLFEEIWEMHQDCDKGCYASNEELGSRVGAAASSVRRYRRKLRDAGYLQEKKTGGRIYKIPSGAVSTDRRAVNSDHTAVSTDHSGQNRPVNTDRSGQNCTEDAVSTDQDMSCINPEGASSRAHAGEGQDQRDRWDFLPSYRLRHLPEIKSEASQPEDTPDVLSIASRYLERPQDDLASTVDHHLSQRSADEVIAAYVIAGREAKSPVQYADKIIREGWTRGSPGGDGSPKAQPLDTDANVIRFGA